MIDANFISAIQGASETKILELDGKQYSTKQLFNAPAPTEHLADALEIYSLTGLVDYCKTQVDGLKKEELILHVVSPTQVNLVSKLTPELNQRHGYVKAKCSGEPFKFGAFLPHSKFMIAIQAQFQDYGDRAKVIKVLGTIRNDLATTSQDDGMTQRVTASAGIALQQEVAVPNPVMLRPYRTFTEIEQPPSQFVLRVQKGREEPHEVALFEADGGRWKGEALVAIREYLTANIPDIAVIA